MTRPDPKPPQFQASARRRPLRGFRFYALAAIVLVPSVGLFCLNYSGVEPRPTRSTVELAAAELEPPDTSRSHSFVADTLNLAHASPGGYLGLAPVRNPFATEADRAMVAAGSDPFLLAYASGRTEGDLVVRSRSGGVVTFGVPTPERRPRSRADREILRNIDQGLGGSFSKFFSSVLSASMLDDASAESTSEENPFLQALRELEPTTAKTTGTPGETASAEKPAASDTVQAKTPAPQETPPQPTKAVVNGGGSVVTVRPHLLLRVDEQGLLRTTAASRPGERVLESVELGVREFQSVTFSEPADAPFAIAAGDFNADGETDVVVHVPLQGLLRFYYARDGEYVEETRIQVGRDPSSVAAGDFNGDGRLDVALSPVGTGLLTVFYGSSASAGGHFKIFWSETYRDYIAAHDSGSGVEILGVSFGNRAVVLVQANQTQPADARAIDVTPAMSSHVSASGKQVRLQAVVFAGGSLAVNLENRQGQLCNVLNVASKADGYAIVGDLEANGRIAAGLTTFKRQ